MHTIHSSTQGGLHQAIVMAFWCGGLLLWPLLWPSGVVAFWVVAFWCGAFCCGCLLLWWPSVMASASRRPYQKAAFNQKATKPEGITEDHNRRPHALARQPPEQTPPARHPPRSSLTISRPPGTRHPPLETCCKACWDTTCNACWDSTPLLTEWQMPVKI